MKAALSNPVAGGVAGRMVLRRLLALGMLCALVVPRLLLAEGTGPLYGKFRPLNQAGGKPPAAQRARRYSGEAGYHLRGPLADPPAYAPSGGPYPQRPAVQGGFFMAYPNGSPGRRFGPGPRSVNAPAQRPSFLRPPDKGRYLRPAGPLSAPPELGYRFRPPGRGRQE
ncbi:hypothetical protein [Sedimenticola hydrogenitrophicus]|uniref:hypothetical protein n=1 Tax=Sedimenticola hydrogenitrophicus TaxID=2967975 RepID=UPI0023B09418|nr:hypothetical protein [Sedimenticola hydrogenitrophicus]